ncbi:MAG: hypothetical protein RR744_09735 [Cellulosilyticaceae bacterium]
MTLKEIMHKNKETRGDYAAWTEWYQKMVYDDMKAMGATEDQALQAIKEIWG